MGGVDGDCGNGGGGGGSGSGLLVLELVRPEEQQ